MAHADRNGLLPVIALSGFLGAGKTTLLNHLIRNADGERIAIIVNDIGEVNIDATLINSEVKQLDGEINQVIELSGGCICCSIQSDLVAAVSELTENLKVDRLIVESTGVAEPVSVAQTFLSEDIAGRPLEESARIDSLVTVVDAAFFLEEWRAHELKRPSRSLLRQEDDRSIFELVIEQIECTDILVANKIDLLDPPDRAKLKAILQSLNERAHYHEATQGQVPKNALLGLFLFDLKQTLSGANWLRHIESSHAKIDLNDRFRKVQIHQSSLIQPNLGKTINSNNPIKSSINTFVYRARRPFDADKFAAVINRSIPGLLRAKGYCWIEDQNEAVGFLSIAGSTTRCDFLGNWWAAALENGKIDRSQLPAEIECKWEAPHGDRRQELVFIGINLNGEALKDQIDACLID
jgi:G3E family GTPase